MAIRKFGILAEDATDSAVVRTIIRRCLHAGVPVKPHDGKGCARLRKKAERWMRQLANEGFRNVILVHDLDRDPETGALNHEAGLRHELERIEPPPGVERLICIPVEELEAWFWADPDVINQVGRGSGKPATSPHLVQRPKEALMRLSRAANGKPRYSTEDNASLAEVLNLELCAERCPSFRKLLDFIRGEPKVNGATA
jgi:hypothetical protein